MSQGQQSQPVFFSIVIPTRNRVVLFQQALESVLAQDCPSREVIVVNDGSTGDVLAEYKALEARYPEVSFHYLVHRPNGHGQSYAMNFGAGMARGRYLCFLDDDDYWTDTGHLSRAQASLEVDPGVDAYYSNQEAYFSNGEKKIGNPWIGDLDRRLRPETADQWGAHPVDTPFLLTSRGFAHLNCSIYRREFYLELGGMDENIRYECDRDIYIRAIDHARRMLFNPAVVSYHRIPDVKQGTNMSTAITDYQKRIYQLNVYEKGALLARQPLVRAHCLRGKGHQLKHVAEALTREGRLKLAATYAREGLAVLPTPGWAARTLLLSLRALFAGK
jgi:glycosyltransferase involved in cell wall biosynthesis